MKSFKYILICLLAVVLINCEEDERSTDFLNNAPAPSDISLLFKVTADNSGLVSMTPSAAGASFFDVFFQNERVRLEPGETFDNVFDEGTYTVKTVATGVNGKTAEIEQSLVVAFIPPQNLDVSIENDGAVSNTVRVNATAEFGINYEVDFGETDDDSDVRMANMGEEIVYEYQAAGLYTITVTAFSAAIETTTFVAEDFEVTEILAPLTPAPIPPARSDQDVIAIYSDTYDPIVTNEFPTEWSDSGFEEIAINGNNAIQYGNLAFTGIVTDYDNPTDLTPMEFVRFDYWTTDATTLGFKIVNTVIGEEDILEVGELVQDEWVTVEFALDDYNMDRSQVTQLLFDALGNRATVFIDNLYFYRAPTGAPPMAGTWRMSADEGFFVGEGAAVYFACNSGDGCSDARACYFDDEYVFGVDGTFSNVLQNETWVEGWQGGPDACATPVAPHDGTADATYTYDPDQSQITLNGTGAYIGLPKVFNGGELAAPADAPESITYDVELTDDNNRMVVTIFISDTVFWRYFLERVSEPSPVEGRWVMSQNEGFSVGDGSQVFFACNSGDGCSDARACFFDDEYVFGSDGSFQNVLQNETWIEGWQGGSDACGAPVAPHDGSADATYALDMTAGELTINGTGAYLGLPKVINGGEISAPADAPDSIVYDVELTDDNTRMVVTINIGGSVFWQYVLVKI